MNKLRHLFLILVAVSTVVSCASFGNSELPLTTYKIPSGSKTQNLLVMFPGINSPGTDFIEHGFVQMFQQKYSNVDITLVDTRIAYISAGNIAERIHKEIILPAIREGYKNIWFVGVSLGGLSAITHNRDFAGNINGVVLIAPYLGAQYKIEDLLAHEPPLVWSQQRDKSMDKTIRLWRYLISETQNQKNKMRLFLAYGDSDRFSDLHRFLASLLNENNVFIEKGGHNWTVWKKLWKTLLEEKVFNF